MRIAITGAAGQLGQALVRTFEQQHTILPLTHQNFELSSPAAREQLIALQPELVIHAAAFTNVDGCARDPQLAYRVNGLGTHYVALACQTLNVPLVYISTNEVFDGQANQPYCEYDQCAPINAYGRSKRAGELAVAQSLQKFYIVRVAWLFGGERNFVRTVLRLADEREELPMVTDQIGSPTFAPDVAEAVAQLIQQPYYGIYHFVNAGVCSRYELAAEALRIAQKQLRLLPILDADFPRPSTPPRYSPLHNLAGAALGIELRPWQAALLAYLSADAR